MHFRIALCAIDAGFFPHFLFISVQTAIEHELASFVDDNASNVVVCATERHVLLASFTDFDFISELYHIPIEV